MPRPTVGPDWEEVAHVHCRSCAHASQRDPGWVRQQDLSRFRCTRCGKRGASATFAHQPKGKADPGNVVALKGRKPRT